MSLSGCVRGLRSSSVCADDDRRAQDSFAKRRLPWLKHTRKQCHVMLMSCHFRAEQTLHYPVNADLVQSICSKIMATVKITDLGPGSNNNH